jgi:HPt (histidine-containing phosphotransfer) domain-containing protein
MSAKLQSLIHSYCSALPQDVQALAEAISLAAGGSDAIIDHLTEALQRLHRIKGAGGSLGFEAVSRAAAQLEAELRKLESVAAFRDGGDLHRVLDSLAQLKELATTIKPEGSTLYGIDLSRMAPPARSFARGA